MDWRDVDWGAALARVMGGAPSPSSPSLEQLLQAAVDSMQEPLPALCGSAGSMCVAGLFLLRMQATMALVRMGQLARATAAALLSPSAQAFARAFGGSPDLRAEGTFQEEFGWDRKEPLTLPQAAFQSLGRLLHQLADLRRRRTRGGPRRRMVLMRSLPSARIIGVSLWSGAASPSTASSRPSAR
ncbi:unnamed protein product [Prorocentrum cordatum]|uniref:Uncharacterized protein n=1 Tax=Prorocentrum cordatum TaxID=2364126 RepID=A0ABN9XJB0_9DINO|nr:unnamed protein product [Polarella glacialis]